MDEKRVVAAVAPAVEIEQRIAEERTTDAHRRRDRVGRRDRCAGRRRADPSSGQRERDVQDEHQRERRDQRAQAAQEPRRVLSSLPVGAEPREPDEQHEQAEAPGPRLGVGEPAGQDQSQAGDGVGHTDGRKRGSVRGQPVCAGIDRDDRADRPGERNGEAASMAPRRGGEACVRHRPILPPRDCCQPQCRRGRIVWSAAMCDAPGRRTVLPCPVEREIR